MGTALDSFGLKMLQLSLVISIFFILLVWYKYSIDTKNTIKELSKDRDLYRNRLWVLMIDNDKKYSRYARANIENDFYKNMKKRIGLLRKDLSETDFNSYENIKEEILLALKDIESYGEVNDTDKNK